MPTAELLDPPLPSDTVRRSGVVPFRWTVRRYLAAAGSGAFRGRKVELIDGEVVAMSPFLHPHVLAIDRSRVVLESAFGPGHWVRTQAPLACGLRSMPEPDVAVVPGGMEEWQDHPTSALLVVEVALSTLRHDRGRKAGLYSRIGIADYWILDLKRRRMEVCRLPQDGGYASRVWLSDAAVVAPVALPNRPIPVASFLPRA